MRTVLVLPATMASLESEVTAFGAPQFVLPTPADHAAWMTKVKPLYMDAYQLAIKKAYCIKDEEVTKHIAACDAVGVFEALLDAFCKLGDLLEPGEGVRWHTTSESDMLDMICVPLAKPPATDGRDFSAYNAALALLKTRFKDCLAHDGCFGDNYAWFLAMKHMPKVVGIPEDVGALRKGELPARYVTCSLVATEID